MTRLLQMLGALAVVYVVYALTLKKWGYYSQAQRHKRRVALKQEGVSTSFYFIHQTTLWILTFLSGGLFAFYWYYQQWRAVFNGFKQEGASPLKYGPFVRTLFFYLSVFTLCPIIDRTCEYMKHTPNYPSSFLATLWLAGLITVFLPVAPMYRIGGFIVFCTIPFLIQRRLNRLVKTQPPLKPRPAEMMAAGIGAACVVGTIAALRSAGVF